MKIPPNTPNDNNDNDGTPFDPPRPHDNGDQKHRRAERKAVLEALTEYSLNPDPATLERIRGRWESGVLNQPHIGKWNTIRPLLDAASHARGFCPADGLVILGYLWQGGQAVNLEQSAEHEELIESVVLYGVHSRTLELANEVKKVKRMGALVEDYYKSQLWKWIKDHPQYYKVVNLSLWYESRSDSMKSTVSEAQKYIDDHYKIHNLLRNLENRIFVFLPTSERWKEFFRFASGYSCLPDEIIKQLGDYYFEARFPSPSDS